jgi:archaellum component FlaF (FlaF/FlaG flagellin family)
MLRTHHSLYRKKGMSTVLGTLIFIGILFSAVVPMQLVMQQADIIKLQRIEEIKRYDDECQTEEISVSAYPVSPTSDQMNIKVSNKGSILVKIVRVWIQDTNYTVNEYLDIGETKVLGPYTVTLVEDTSYPVTLTTERGRIFAADHISLFYSDGQWYTPSRGINVYIANEKGKYYILVNNDTWSTFYQTQGMDQGDLIKYFEVDSSGGYTVTCRKNNSNGPFLPGTPVNVEILWPSGPPIVFVYTSGK